jgi:hypothetical protein
MKVVNVQRVPTFDIVNNDGSEVEENTKTQVREIAALMQDAQVLGPSSPLGFSAAIRIASAILSTYSLARKEKE